MDKEKKKMSNQEMTKTRKLTMTAMLSAVAFVLMYFEFSVPFVPAFLKMDLSELPELIAAFSMGPVSGVFVCLIKNVLHCAVTQSATVGELSNFLLSAVFVIVAGLIYKKLHNRKGAVIGALAGTAAAALVSVVTNYFVVYPFYAAAYMPMEVIMGMYQAIRPSTETLLEALVIFNVPFTFIKFFIADLLTFAVYKRLSPILKGQSVKNKKVQKTVEELAKQAEEE